MSFCSLLVEEVKVLLYVDSNQGEGGSPTLRIDTVPQLSWRLELVSVA